MIDKQQLIARNYSPDASRKRKVICESVKVEEVDIDECPMDQECKEDSSDRVQEARHVVDAMGLLRHGPRCSLAVIRKKA